MIFYEIYDWAQDLVRPLADFIYAPNVALGIAVD